MHIENIGLCSAYGVTHEASLANVEAGLLRFRETVALDRDGEPVRAAPLTMMEPLPDRTDRIVALAHAALQECVVGKADTGAENTPLFLGLPHHHEHAGFDPAALLSRLQEAISSLQGVTLNEDPSFFVGRAAFFFALKAALSLLQRGQHEHVLVGSADSLCDAASLAHLAQQRRNLSTNQRDGIVPGEGAAILRISRTGSKASARVLHVEHGHEPRHYLQDDPSRSEGLSNVLRGIAADAAVKKARADVVVTCQTNERYYTQEFVRAYLRNGQLFPEPLDMHSVTTSFGDLGAASGSVATAMALDKLGQRTRALIYGCSDHGAVGATMIERCEP